MQTQGIYYWAFVWFASRKPCLVGTAATNFDWLNKREKWQCAGHCAAKAKTQLYSVYILLAAMIRHLILGYGRETEPQRILFCALSFWAWYEGDQSGAQTIIFTDRPEFFVEPIWRGNNHARWADSNRAPESSAFALLARRADMF
ncbi:hypothetical protein A0257_11645 [Hymenobacter psoromatis]|nr:hypothetical protein A0257_11645 [Hymenobacter psoromatis]